MANLGDIVRSEYYATHGYPHEAWTQLRRESPVHRFELDGYDPFWAVTRYDDIARVSRQPRMFLNAPRLAFSSRHFPVRPPEDASRRLKSMCDKLLANPVVENYRFEVAEAAR